MNKWPPCTLPHSYYLFFHLQAMLSIHLKLRLCKWWKKHFLFMCLCMRVCVCVCSVLLASCLHNVPWDHHFMVTSTLLPPIPLPVRPSPPTLLLGPEVQPHTHGHWAQLQAMSFWPRAASLAGHLSVSFHTGDEAETCKGMTEGKNV